MPASGEGAPKVLLFDVMGVLVHDPFYLDFPRFFGLSLEELLEMKHPSSWIEFEHGRIDEAGYLASVFADGRAVDGDALKACLRSAYRWLPGMEALVNELFERGVPMHALSNYSVWYRMIDEVLGLSRYVNLSFVSCETGVRKPDPEAYLGAARALELEPAACLFIDDTRANIAGAERVGMPALRFTGAEALRRDLSARGVLTE